MSERELVSPGTAHEVPEPAERGGPLPPSGQASAGSESAASGWEPAAGERDEAAEQAYRDVVYDAMVVALSGRIFLARRPWTATPEQVLRQIWEDHFILGPAAAAPG